jgi:predicted Ser/Thr protein kinase
MNEASTFHCPHCGAGNPASEGVLTCHACHKQFEPARVETVAQPASQADAEPATESSAANADAGFAVLPRGVELGGYRIEREIGRGGMGVVYLGIQKSLDRRVAVKVLPKRLADDPKFRIRFEREALALATLNHANIVQIIDRGIAGDIFYLVMEYVDGVSLRRLQLDGKLPAEQALAIVPQICTALEYAHGKGIVHRDIKPENILLTTDGQVKITDFGLARIVHGDASVQEQRLTHTNVLMGTPEYMAPEQRERARTVDHRADIFSLGVIFYEMLTGELPLGRFQVPSKKVALDVRLDEVILKSLEKEPDLRYQRAQQLSKDVEGIASTYGSKSEPASAAIPAGAPIVMPESARAASKRVSTLSACFQLKDGRRIEVGPRGVRVFEPAPAVAPQPIAPGPVPQPSSPGLMKRREVTPSGYSGLAIAAFMLAIVPLGLCALLFVFVGASSSSSSGVAMSPTINVSIRPVLLLVAVVVVTILVARKFLRKQT